MSEEFDFQLPRSQYFATRSRLLKSNGIPKLSDVKINLGDTAAKVVFDQCEPALLQDFGLKMPLKGPGDTLWISPSDLLIGKLALKPPFTPKCLQALTHKGILEIGLGLENKFREEMELDKQRALEKYKNELLATVEDRMKSEIKDVEIRERLACQMELEKRRQAFEEILKKELDNLEEKIRKEYSEIITSRDLYFKVKYEEKLQEEIRRTVDAMTKSFLKQLDEQEERLSNIFTLEIKKQEILRDFEGKLHKRKTIESLRQLKHNLECTNLVNMMYILCMERRKCCDQKAEIERHYQNEIKKLEEKLKAKSMELEKMTTDRDGRIKEVEVREACLTTILEHFQKFINFALRAAPTQAEFLLSVEKMMVFELTNNVAKSVGLEKTRPVVPIIPWAYDGNSTTSEAISSLEIRDYHNCLDELYPPIQDLAEELDEDDTLPAIYFKNKTYVREDFRDMLTAGVKLSPSNDMWNRDVELLVNLWREQHSKEDAGEHTEAKTASTAEGSEESLLQNLQEVEIRHEKRRSNKSIVQFSETGSRSSRRESSDSPKGYRKGSLKPSAFAFVEDVSLEPVNVIRSNSKLLAARDSIDVLMEKKIKSGISLVQSREIDVYDGKTPEEHQELDAAELVSVITKELVIGTRDSVMQRKSEMARRTSTEFSISPKDSIEVARHAFEDKTYELQPKTSKLTSARNSVELLKESLMKLKMPSLYCQRKVSKKRLSKESKDAKNKFDGLSVCCDRCKHRDDGLDTLTKDGTQVESLMDDKSVKISANQITNLVEQVMPSTVSFTDLPIFIQKSISEKTSSRSSKSRFSSARKRQPHVRKEPQRVEEPTFCKVVGDVEAKEGIQHNDEFTAERIHSLVKLMSDQPYLMQLFTGGRSWL